MNFLENLTRKYLISLLSGNKKNLPIKAVIFGTGETCDNFIDLYKDSIKIKAFFDNQTKKKIKYGKSVLRPTYARGIDKNCSIFIASSEYDAISTQLKQLGYYHFHHRLNAQILINPITPFFLEISHDLFLFIINELKEARIDFTVLESIEHKNSSLTLDSAKFHLFADSGAIDILESNRGRIDRNQDKNPVYVVAIHCIRGNYDTGLVNLYPDMLIRRLIDSSRRDHVYHKKINPLGFERIGPIFFELQQKVLSGKNDYRNAFLETDRNISESKSDFSRSSWVSLELSRAYERQMFFLGFDTTLMRKQLIRDSNGTDDELIFVILRDSCSEKRLVDYIRSFFEAKGLVFGCHIPLLRREKILLRDICRGGNWVGSRSENLSGYPDGILVFIDEKPQKSRFFLDERSPLFYRKNSILNLKNELRRQLNLYCDSKVDLNFFHISDDEIEAFQYISKIERLRIWILDFLKRKSPMP